MAFEGNTWWTYMLFSLIVITALLGNSLVIYVLVTRSSYLNQSYNVFIFSLAVTDICTAVFLIFSRYLYLPGPHGSTLSHLLYCKVIWSAWVPFTLGYISIYTCTALTFERWLAVVKPLTYRAIKRAHVVKCIACVWLWGVAINMATLFRVKYDEKCSWTPLPVGNEVFTWVNFTLQSVVPFTAMVALYAHILYKMRRLSTGAVSLPVKKITKVALAASSAIIVGWLPSRVSFAMSKYGIVDPSSLFHYCLVVFAFANSCINPFLYGIYSSQFRNEYKVIFRELFKARAPPRPQTRSRSPTPAFSNTLSDVNTAATTRF